MRFVKAFMKMMGLRTDLKYEDVSEVASLRYGRILILCDADHDGYHIMGLIITLITAKFPGLLQHDLIHFMSTPIIKAYKGKNGK